ncbi:MAG: hypothetical protein ACYTGX_18375 [Planctomycetota bacterium]|jgi:hypothetical protein
MSNAWTKILVLAGLAAGALAGCASGPPPATYVKPKYVSMLTDGVAIHDEAGAWTITGSDPVAPPFYSEAFNWDPAEGGTIDRFDDALLMGARKVKVEYPGLEKPLYGVLAICPINESTTESSAKRAYRMAVPESYVQQARGARISVVYQPYKIVVTERPGGLFIFGALAKAAEQKSSHNRVSWILWMSDAPFASEPSGLGGAAGR